MEVVKNIGTVIGLVLSVITLITLCCKPLRRKIGNVIRKASNMEETSQALDEVRAMMQQIMATEESNQAMMENFKESQLSLLRDSITRLYFKYLPEKQVPTYGRKDMVNLFESYQRLGGNSYVRTIYEEFMEWQVRS